MGLFFLKQRDTRPILEVVLKNPDGSVHDLSGAAGFKLHIWLADGTKISRDMVQQGAPTDGTLRYTWVDTDWNTGNLAVTTGHDHRMEYEVIAGTVRMTFPNYGYDALRIIPDIGQG